jgi:phage/plasmid-like protein (TIGR03299 family)
MKINVNSGGAAALKAALEARKAPVQAQAEEEFNQGFKKTVSSVTPTPTPPPPKPNPQAAVTGPRKHVFSSLKRFNSQDFNDIIDTAGFDLTAEKRKQKIDDGEGNFTIENPDMVAIFNKELNKYIGSVGTGYGIVQYPEMLRWTEVLVKQGDASYLYGGITGDGRRAFLVMKTADYLEVTPGDRIDCLFYVTTSHNGKTSLSVVPTPYRSASNTTFNIPGITALKFRHTKNVAATMQKASQTLVKVRDYFTDFEVKFKRLQGIQLTDQRRADYLKMLIPDTGQRTARAENMRGQIDSIIQTERSLQLPGLKGTLLGAYFGAVHFCDHYMTVRKSSKQDELSSRIESKLDGAGAQRKAEALGVALEMQEKFGGA